MLDIEGTTTLISFVKNELFPFAKKEAKSFLENHWEEEETKETVAMLKALNKQDLESTTELHDVPIIEGDNKEQIITTMMNNIIWQIDHDRKVCACERLKFLTVLKKNGLPFF